MEHIRLCLSDWQYNAGIVGIYNVLKYAGKDILQYTIDYAKSDNIENINPNYELFFPVEYLENFTDNYYRYLIDTYTNQISYGKIIGKKEWIQNYLSISDDEITKENIDNLTDYIKDVQKYMKSNSYKAAYELIDDSDEVLAILGEIKPIKVNKKDVLSEKKSEIIDVCSKILQLIEKMQADKWKKYIGGKNIIYNVLRNNWDGVSVLNRSTKYKDIYEDFDDYFVKPALDYICADKAKYKFNCFCCDNPIKSMDNNLSFLTNTGFDTARKPSHVWDFQNDIGICDLCKLIYSCMPAGFYYGYDKGIFVNANTNITSLLDVNEKLKLNVKRCIVEKEQSATYKSVVEAVLQSKNESVDYELCDVQVIFYENEKYVFNILHKNILDVISESEKEFERLKKGSFREKDKYYYLYEETTKNVLNNKNSFLWINKLLHYYISGRADCYYNLKHIEQIIKINFNYMKGVGLMDGVSQKIIDDMKNYGWHLRSEYVRKGASQKLDGISYKLLNALKTSNVNEFMDVLIRCYMYSGKEIPKNFINCLKDEEQFKTNGYAFVVGLNGSDFKNDDGGKENEYA